MAARSGKLSALVLVTILLLPALAVSVAAGAPSSPPQAPPPAAPHRAFVAPSLQALAKRADAKDLLPVTIVLSKPLETPDAEDRAEAARARAASAESSQSSILAFLDREAARGRAADVSSLWTVNAVSAKVTPAVLKLLERRSDVEAVWKSGEARVSLQGHNPLRAEIIRHLSEDLRSPKLGAEDHARLAALYRSTPPAVRPVDDLDPDWAQEWIGADLLMKRAATGAGTTLAVLDSGAWGGNPELDHAIVDFIDFTRRSADRATGSWAYHAHPAAGFSSLRFTADLTAATVASLSFRSFHDLPTCYYSPGSPYEHYCEHAKVVVRNEETGGEERLAFIRDRADGPSTFTVDLTPWAGRSIVLEFILRGAAWNTHSDGWFVDDVTLVLDGAAAWVDDAESAAGRASASGGWKRWARATYDTPMFAAGNGREPAVATSPNFDLASATGPFAINVTWFKDSPGSVPVYLWASSDLGANWTFIHEFRDMTRENLASQVIPVPAALAGAASLQLAFASTHGFGSGTPGAPPRNWASDIPEHRGFALARVALDGLAGSATTTFGDWTGEGGFALRPLSSIAYDDAGHGTAVAGVIAADGSQRWHRGIAPEADLVIMKVFNREGWASERDLLDAYAAVAARDGVDILSYSGGSFETTYVSTWSELDDGYAFPARFDFEVGGSPSHPASYILGYVEMAGWDGSDAWDYEDPHPLIARFIDPSGSSYQGVPVDWVLMPEEGTYDDERVWFHKLTADAPLPSGTWSLVAELDPATHPAKRSGDGALWIGNATAPGSPWEETSRLTRTFDFAGLETVTLSFWTRYSSALGSSCGRVVVEEIGGPLARDTLHPDFDPVYHCDETWYNATSRQYEWTNWYQGWSGDGWREVVLNLTAFAGRAVNVTFEWNYASWSPAEGWFIDDLAVPELGYETGFDVDLGDWIAVDPTAESQWRVVSENPFRPAMYAAVAVGYPDDGSSPQSRAIDAVAESGILPVVAAGNDGGGSECDLLWDEDCPGLGLRTINTPAAARRAYAVGASAREHDRVASFSSLGPVGFGDAAYVKPDVVAPGVEVRTLYNWGGASTQTGTSFAAPQAAALAALILEADPARRAGLPGSVTSLMNATAVDIGVPGYDAETGWGRIDAFGAVNLTGRLPPLLGGDAPTRSLGHELYAGTIGWPTYSAGATRYEPRDDQPMAIMDRGHNDSAILDLRAAHIAAADATGATAVLEFHLDRASPGTSVVLYIDLDQDAATGERGADTRLRFDFAADGSVANLALDRWNAGGWTDTLVALEAVTTQAKPLVLLVRNLDDSPIAASDLGAPEGLRTFRAWLEATRDGAIVDRAPDAGYGLYPTHHRAILASAFSWNQTARAPQAGEPIAFRWEALRAIDCATCAPVVLAQTVVATDASGRAEVSFEMTANRTYETHRLVIEDTHGNRAVQAFTPGHRVPPVPTPDPSSPTPGWRLGSHADYSTAPGYYYVDRTGSLNLSWVVMDRMTGAPYAGNATIRIRNEWYCPYWYCWWYGGVSHRTIVSEPLTAVGGVFSWSVPYASLPQPSASNPYDAWTLHVDLAPAEGPAVSLPGGYAYLAWEDDTSVEIRPYLTSAAPGDTVDLVTILASQSFSGLLTPHGGPINVTVSWVTERDAAALLAIAPQDLAAGLARALAAPNAEDARRALSREDVQRLIAFQRDGPLGFRNFETRASYTIPATGIGSFPVVVPEGRVLYGWVTVEDVSRCSGGYYGYCPSDGALIVVPSILARSGPHRPPVSEGGGGDPEIDTWIQWGHDARTLVSAETATLHISAYDDGPMADLDLWIYTAHGGIQQTRTDMSGTAVVTIPARAVNLTKANFHDRYLDAWVVSTAIDPSNGHALADHAGTLQWAGFWDWVYFGSPPQTSSPASSTSIDILGGFVGNELRATVRWLDANGAPATGVASAIQAYKSLYGPGYAHRGILHNEHASPPTGEWPVTLEASEFGEYTVAVLSAPTIPSHVTRTFHRAPFEVSLPALESRYPAHATIPLPIVVTRADGAPVVGAEVWAFLDVETWCWPDMGEDGMDALATGGRPAGHNCVDDADRAYFRAVRGVTDENGAATLEVKAPHRGGLYVDLEMWVTDGEQLANVLVWTFWTQTGATLPNLEVSLRALPTVLAVGQQTVFEAVVRNTGSAASPATTLRLERDGIVLRDVAIPALSGGANAVVPLVWGSNDTGAFALRVAVDPLGEVAEASEADNQATTIVRVTRPNLVATPVVVPPPRALVGGVEHVNLGTPYALSATIRNLGEIPTPASTHRILAGATVLATATDPGLAPGDAFEIAVLWTPSALGPVDLTVVADVLGSIAETNETDNRAIRRVVVAESPDLIVRAVRAPAAVRVNSPAEFEFRVSNIGGLTTSVPTTLRFTSGSTVVDVPIPALGPGQNVSAVVTTSFGAPGFASWSVVADALGEVAEFSETNNGAAGSTAIRFVNLVVSLLAPDEVWLGAETRLKATVVNEGTWTSTATTLDITDALLPGGTALSPAATAIPIPALSPNRGHTVDIPAWSTLIAGLHRLEAILPAGIDDNAAGNAAARDVVAEAAYVRDLCAFYQDPVRPAGVEAFVTFRTNVRGSATITAVGAGALGATPVTLTRTATQGWNHVSVAVPSTTVGAAVLTITVAVPGASATVVSGEPIDGCPMPALSVRAKPVIVKDTNHTVADVSPTPVTKRVDVWTFDIATLEQEFVIDVKAGAQGRILSGLEYLRFYPNSCVEQTTSPMLAALHVIEYYKARGVYDELGNDSKASFDSAVRAGVGILTSGHNKQKPSGGWAMYGSYSEAANFYSAFATHGLLTVREDPTYRDLVDGSGVNYTRIPGFFASTQKADGAFGEGSFTWYLRSEIALTALILKDLSLLRPLIADEATRATLDRVALNATRYLLSMKSGGAWPDYPGMNGNPFSTASAIWGLQTALDAGILPSTNASQARAAVADGVAYLEGIQRTGGGWTRDTDNANYYTSFLESALHAETTAIVVLALNATGLGLENAAVTRGVNYLYNVYRDGGSFGNTRTTQAAVHALALLQRVQTIAASVEVYVDGTKVALVNLTTNAPDCQFKFDASGIPRSLTPACDITFTGGTMAGLLARTRHNVTFTVLSSSVPTLLAAYNRQHGDYDEAMATVPARYIDPIATTFFLDLAWPAESIQNEATTITASFRNDEPLSIFSPAIAVPLGSTLAAANTVSDPPTMRFADGTETALEFEVVNGILYLLPQYVPEASTTTFRFKVRPLVAGAVGITATGYPLYNDQLMAVASATGNVKGYGALRVDVVDENGQPFAGATTTLGSTSLAGASVTFTNVLEGAKTLVVTAPGRLAVTGAVDVARGATTPVKVALLPAASAPRWIYTTAASAGTAPVDDVTTDETYTRLVRAAVSATGGVTTVAYTIPAGHTLRGVTFEAAPVAATMTGGVAYVTLAGALDGDLVYDLESPDRIAPTITIVAPTPDATNVVATAPISLTFADFKGVHAASLAFAVDGANVTAAAVKTAPAGLLAAVAWTPNPALAAGSHTATVSVADLAGNVATRTWSFTVVAAAPDAGAPPATGTPGVPTAPGTRATVALLAGGSSTTAALDAARVRSVRLTAGGSDLADLVVDVAPRATLAETGASQAAPGFVLQYLDITVTSGGRPLAAGALEGAAIRFAVPRAWMEAQRLAPAHVSLAHWTGGAWTVLATTLVSEDATTLVFEATTSGFSPFAIVGRDEIRPSISSLRPNDGEVTSSTTVTASYSDDSAIDLSSVRLTLDGQPVTVVAGLNSLTATLTGLTQGAHQLVLTVADVHGNVATRTSRFTYSVAAPAIAIESPAHGAVVESGRVAIRAALTGLAGVTNANVRVTIDGNAVPATVAGGFAVATIDLAEGPHQLVVTATDLAGRTTQATSDFRVDLAPPTLAPEFPTGRVSGLVRIPTGASDSAGVDRVEVYVDGVLVQTIRTAPWVAEIDTTDLPDGTHLVSFVVYDRANRSTTRSSDLDAANGADEVLGEGRGILGIPGPGAVAWLAALGVAAALLATARSPARKR
ncbi:MAG TPA: CARDB domain-containing protein [Candidatus Thermoplasmatota archaeon]|nr:CARDB domain-containing protein [Candidatus Thermoplasmatota archaeon]